MALLDSTKAVYSPTRVGDLTLVFVTLIAGSGQAALDTTRSSPGVTIATPGSGVYTISFASNSKVVCLQSEGVNQSTVKIAITGAAYSAGTYSATATLSDGGDLAGSEEMHLCFASMANP